MVTTRNSQKNSVNFNAEASFLLDELRLILNSTKHMTNAYGDIRKYVHKKPACYNICKISTGSKYANYNTSVKEELVTNNTITKGGKAFAF